MEEKTLYTRAAKRINRLGINLPRNVQNLYENDFEIISKETKVDLKNGKIYHVLRKENSVL